MKNISSQYQELQEGKMTKHQFLRNARMMFPSFVTNQNSFADSVAILKTKGMLVEGDAVKGTPDKEPTYDSPTPDAKTKYKKVEQSPEVDEQDGVYPATTLTDIPKIKANKKVKDTSSGLEPIKDNDTKNEMKKVKVVKESIEADIEKAIRDKKIDPAKVKAAAEKAMRGDSTKLAFLMAFGDKTKPVGENIEPEKIKDAEKEITKNDASIQTMADKLGISQEELFKMLLKRLGGLNETINYDNLSKHNIKDLEALIDVKKKEREKLRSNTNIPPAVQNTVKELSAQISKIEREINSKKAQSLDENERSFDDVFGDFIETDDATEIKAFIKAKGREAIAKIKAKLPVLKDQARQKVAKLMKIELDEMKTTQTPADTLSVTQLFKRIPQLDQKLSLINNAAEMQDIFDYILDRVNPSIGASDTQLRTALNQAIQANLDIKKSEKLTGTSSNNNIKERLKPAITKLVQEVLDEMGQ